MAYRHSPMRTTGQYAGCGLASAVRQDSRPVATAAATHGEQNASVRGSAFFASGMAWIALSVALGVAGVGTSTPASAAEQSQGELRRYDIAPGTMDQVLGRFGRDAGVQVVIDPALTNGLRSQGLSGSFDTRSALDALLSGSGLEVVTTGQGSYRLQRAPRTDSQVSALAPVTVTGRRSPAAAVYETPGAVAVVTREQMERIPPRSIGDVLSDVAGVYSAGSRQTGALSVNIRGMQDFGRVNVMIDGTRQNYQQSGHGANGSVYVDPELLSRVDITKGPSSTAGGAGVIGGVVNFRTLEAEDLLRPDARYGGQVTATTGNNAYRFSGSAAAAIRLTPSLSFVAGVSRKSLGDFKPGSRGGLSDSSVEQTVWPAYILGQQYWSGLAKLSWQPSPSHHLKFSYLGFDTRRDLSRESSANSRVQRETLIGNYEWTPDNSWFDVASSLYYTRTRNQEQRDGSDVFGYGAYDVRYQTSTVGGTLENTARFDLGSVNVAWRLGGEFFHDWTSPQAQTEGASLQDQANYNSVWFTGSTPEGQRTVVSAFTEATLRHGDWLEATGGVRYDWYGLKGDGKIMAGSIANPPGVRPGTTYIWTAFGVDRNASAVSPKLTVAVKPWQPLQLFASASRGMRPPAITETLLSGSHPGNLLLYYPNPNLREERARNWEVGANLILNDVALQNDSLKLKAVWFDSKVKDYMAMAVVKSPTGDSNEGSFAPRAYVNLNDPFRSRGLELQLEYDADVVFGALTYTHMVTHTGEGGYDPYPLGSVSGYPATRLGQPGDNNIGYMLPPRKMMSLTLGTRLLDRKLTLGSRLRLRSPQHVQVAEQLSDLRVANVAGARIFDLWASYAVTPDITVRLSVENLTDRNYSELSNGSYFLAPGRTFTATLSARF